MQSRPTQRPNPDQEQAFRDSDVLIIVAGLLRHRDVRLVKLARQAVNSPKPVSREELRLRLELRGTQRLTVAEEMLDSAEQICQAGARIFSRTECERLKGGLLERYVHDMVSLREPGAVGREREIELPRHPHSGRPWSKPKEVVVNSSRFEVYECKWGGRFDQDDINELGDIWVSGQAEGSVARPCIAAMASQNQIQANLSADGVVLEEALFIADDRDLPELQDRAPSRQISGRAIPAA